MASPHMPRLQLLGQHLAALPGLRLECSWRLLDGRLQTRPKPMFWLGAAHRHSRVDFDRLHGLLSALECPSAWLELHRQYSVTSRYQGVAVDLDARHNRGTLFMHYRDETGERRLGLAWDGDNLQRSEYCSARLSQSGEHHRLLHQVHAVHRDLLAALLRDTRLLDQGGYWVQHRQGQAIEIYLTYPWHPSSGQLWQPFDTRLLARLPDGWQRHQEVLIRHIGFSCQSVAEPTLTFYTPLPRPDVWPSSQAMLERGLYTPTQADAAGANGHCPLTAIKEDSSGR